MKIAIFLESTTGPTIGFIRDQIGLIAEDHEVHVITWKETSHLDFENVKEHFVQYIPFGAGRISKAFWWRMRRTGICDVRPSRSFKRLLTSKINSIKPDLIHVQFATNSTLLFYANHFKDYPVVIQIRGYDATSQIRSRPGYARNLREILARDNVHLVSVASFLALHLIDQKILSGSFDLLHSLTDMEFFDPAISEEPYIYDTYDDGVQVRRLVQIGSFRSKKGQIFAIQSFAKLSPSIREFLQLHFYGEGETKEQAVMEAERLGLLGKQVFFHSWASRTEVRSILASAHAVIHFAHTDKTGDTEGIPNFLMEAMAMRLPVAATRHAGIPELVENGVNGILVSEHDYEAAAAAIKSISGWQKMDVNRIKIDLLFSRHAHKLKLTSLYQKYIAMHH